MAVELALASTQAEEEDRLVAQCRAGHPEAFDELVARYTVRLYRFAYRMLRNSAEAEDAVQDAFVRAYRALPTYRPSGFFSSWIYRIALNECRRRIHRKHPTAPLETASMVATSPDPQCAFMASERNRNVRNAVESLPEHYRLVLGLFYFEELSVQQVALVLGLSETAVKVRLHRGRERLARRLNADG